MKQERLRKRNVTCFAEVMRNRIAVYTFLLGFIPGIREAAAQRRLTVGAEGGLSLTDAMTSSYIGGDESRRYLVGPSVEFRLPARFAVQAEALYQRVGSSSAYQYGGTQIQSGVAEQFSISSNVTRVRGNSWQFPLLAKYYFKSERSGWQPFVGTGYAFGATWFHSEGTTTTTDSSQKTISTPFTYDYRGGTSVGAVFTGGVRIQSGRLAFLPQARFNYWGNQNSGQARRTATVLLGIQF